MRSLAFATGLSAVAIWVLLYANEVRSGPPSLWGEVLYVSALLCPSACFWYVLRSSASLIEEGGRRFLLSCFSFSVLALCVGALILTFTKPSLRETSPALFSASVAAYACGLIGILATLIGLPGPRKYIVHNHLLGLSALAVVAGTALVLWITRLVSTGNEVVLGPWRSLLVDCGCLAALLLAFLSLLNESRSQIAMGLIAVVGLVLLVMYTRFEVFFSILMEGTLFWPFVILCSLIAEVTLFRAVLGSVFRRFLQV
jgi:hypothetical protein